MANEAKQFTIGGVTHDVMDVGARQAITSLQNAIDAITSGDTTTAIKTFQEVIDFLDGVTDDATLIGKLNELRTLINAKYSKPASGIPASDLADGVIPDVSGFATKTEVNAKANSADVVPNTRTVNGKALSSDVTIGMEDIQGLETAIADAGKVKSVSVNGGTAQTPDGNGNVNVSVPTLALDDAPTAGSNNAVKSGGIKTAIDNLLTNLRIVNNEWYIGNTATGVSAQGPQGPAGPQGPKGDSGVASADEVVVVNDLDGEPDNLPQGKVAVLGAEIGGTIGDRLDEIDTALNDVFGGEVNVVVNGNRVTLEIGASASEPRLIINAYATDFMDTELNTSKVKHFTLTGRKLTANASISIASSNSAFLLSADGTNYLPTITLNAGSDGKVSQVVYVKFTPTSEMSYSATITATCGTASATTTYQGTGAAEVTPSIVLQSNLDTITTDAVGNPATLQFVVYGYNLNAPIALSASVDSGSTAALDINSVSAADAENGKVVTLTFTPGDATDDTITITATSSGATTQTLAITGKVVLPPAVDDLITVDGLYYKVTTAATKQTQGAAKLVRPDGLETSSGNSTYTGDITIPASVTYNGYTFAITKIGSYAFNNANVNKVVVGGGITAINGYQMSNSKMKELVVSDNLTSFGAYSCNGSYLTDLTIGTGLTSIGNGAFSGQTGIKRITIKAATPPSVGTAWPALSGVTLRVPAASVSAYQSATPWSDSSIYTIQAITE